MNTEIYVGTRKGGFIFSSDEKRTAWQVAGPFFAGWSVQDMMRDSRNGRLYAALDHMVYGSNIHYSADNGQSWQIAEGQYPISAEGPNAKRFWTIQAGHNNDDLVWAGADPGALFKSVDQGQTWQAVESVSLHPTREKWMAGAGGLMVHTIRQDPTNQKRLFIAISAAGVFRSDDGGETWVPKNKGVAATFLANPADPVGHCCHHLVMSHQNPNRLYQQNHCGVYRSDDAGDSWVDIGAGLPATFGFPMVVHPKNDNIAYVVPQLSDEYRYTPEGKFRVYRTEDAGASWQALTDGLPQENAFMAVYRQAMAADDYENAGIYVGSTGGQLYHSRNNGDSWQLLSNTLPPIYSITTACF